MKKLLFCCVALLSYERLLLSSSSVPLRVNQVATQKESKFAKLFERAIHGDSEAFYEINREAKNALGLSNEAKRDILQELEKALDAAVEKKFQTMKSEIDSINARKEQLEHEGEKGWFERLRKGSMSSEQVAQEREELDRRATDLSQETMRDISDISIPSRKIIDELAPMLDLKSQNIVASYDRTPYHDKVSLIDTRDFDLDHMPTDQTIDTYVRNQINSLAKEGKISVPEHKLSKEPFYSKVVNKVVDWHSMDKNIDDLSPEVQRRIDIYTTELARRAHEATHPTDGQPKFDEVTKAFHDIQSLSSQTMRAITHEKLLQLHDAQEALQRQMVERQQAQERDSMQRQSRAEEVAVVRGV